MKKRLFIHIGTAKTGTSSLQGWFSSNAETLKQYYSICYPQAYRRNAAHHELAKKINTVFSPKHRYRSQLVTDKDILSVAEIKESFANEVNENIRTVVISSEGFSGLRLSENIEKIKNAMSEYQVTVVVYVRHLVDQLEASYSQGVKANKGQRSQKITQCRRPEKIMGSNLTNRQRMIEQWASVFGMENIVVRPYGRENMVEGDIISDFLHHTKILDYTDNVSGEYLIRSESSAENISLPTFKTEILRKLNASDYFDGMSIKDRNKFVRKLNNSKMDIPKNVNFFSRKLAENIVEAFYQRELELAENNFPHLKEYFTTMPDRIYIDDLSEEKQRRYLNYIDEVVQRVLLGEAVG